MKSNKFRVANIQNNAGDNWEKNILHIHQQIKAAAKKKVKLVALPEVFYFRGHPKNLPFLARELSPFAIKVFKAAAKKFKIAILLGSLIEPSAKKKLYYNTSYLISEKGRVAAKYRKIHLFDIRLKGKVKISESDHVTPGNKLVTGSVWGIRMGLAVCYDLRFPELFRRLTKRGSRIIFLPANFTEATGVALWEVLLRARAIENQAFIIAPGQTGIHPHNKIKSYGNSMIVDPWGTVLSRGSRSKQELLIADLDLGYQNRLRKGFPVLDHRKIVG